MVRKAVHSRGRSLQPRRVLFESLEGRLLLASTWQNPHDPFDVNGDGTRTEGDFRIVVSELNANGARLLTIPIAQASPPPFFDVNGDRWLSAGDALALVNARTNSPASFGTGPSSVTALAAAIVAPPTAVKIFKGHSPPLTQQFGHSSGMLYLGEDVAGSKKFRWISDDPILGHFDTGNQYAVATIWNYLPGNPPRLVFTGSAGGAMFSGNVLFGTYNRAVVDVVKGTQRVRYLLEVGVHYSNSEPVVNGCPTCESGRCTPCEGDAENVRLHTGEVSRRAVDLEIPGRGMNWSFQRSYRSETNFVTPLGDNWDFSDNRRLWVVTSDNVGEARPSFPNAQVGDVVRIDGMGRADLYRRNSDGSYSAPNGFYTALQRNPDSSFAERFSNGRRITYDKPGPGSIAPMTTVSDRNGNTLTYHYNALGQLDRVSDTMGRPIHYFYDTLGHLIEVRDFHDRSIRFQYDANDDLVAVTSPSVTGTPHGNDFPAGKTERYTYTSGFANPRLNHLLQSVTAPNEVANGGPPRMIYVYDTDPNSPHAGRVLRQTIGGVNETAVPAGGTIVYQYDTGFPPVGAGDFDSPVMQTTVTDRNGNRTEYQFNQQGNVLRIREFSNRDIRTGDPEHFETRSRWNRDYELLEEVLPEGNTIQYTYDSGNPDRLQQGNLLSIRRLPDTDRGGDQTALTTIYAYEPIFNQKRAVTEPRGTDPAFVPQNGGLASPERYTTRYTYDYEESCDFSAIGARAGRSPVEVQDLLLSAGMCSAPLGDVNGDGRIDQVDGHAIRIDAPAVNLLPGSNQAIVEGHTTQEISTRYAYNDFGQLSRLIDREGNVTQYEYYSERDPDGDGVVNNASGDALTGGYLRQVTRDAESHPDRNSATNPPPSSIRARYQYDPVGNTVRAVDGRGIATDFVVNQLNQNVQTVRAAEHDLFSPEPSEPAPLVNFQYIERFFYDDNDNLVLRQVEDRGNTSHVDGNPSGTDLPSGVPGATNPDPVGGTAFVDTVFRYDMLDQQIEMLEEVLNGASPEFLRTRYRYDPNGNRVLIIQPEGNATSAIYDERDLLFRSIRGSLQPPDAEPGAPHGTAPTLLSSTDPTNYNVRGGVRCQCNTYRYDGNRNVVESVDADDTDGSPYNGSLLGPGDRSRYVYDGFDRQTSLVDSVGNQTVYQYDPAGNVVRSSRFGPVGGASPTADGGDLGGPASSLGVIQSTNLVSDNLLEATENLYDELGRRFQIDRVLFVNTIPTVRLPDAADGASDLGKGNLTPGDNHDIPGVTGVTILGRVSGRTEYDRSSRPTFTVDDDGDTTRYFYDGANRVIRTEDPAGNVVQTAFDDNGNVIERHETDIAQVAGVAPETFLTTYFYDSLDRIERSVDNLGQTLFNRYDSRNNLVSMADAQGPLNGVSISRRSYPEGLLTINDINDFGNVTRYFYDGVNRQTRRELILTDLRLSNGATRSGDGVHIGASVFGVKDDPAAPESFTPTPDPSQGGGDGVIRQGYTYDGNRLLSAQIDDNGNITLYLYDNLNRRVTETNGLVTTSPFTTEFLLGDRRVTTPTAATINDPDFIPPEQIQLQLDAAQTRIEAIKSLFPPLAADVHPVEPPPPQATTVIYAYDPDDNVVIVEDGNDTESFMRYDAINRPIAVRVFRAGQSDSHVGDPVFAPDPHADFDGPHRGPLPVVVGTTRQDFQYDGLSRLVRATDDNETALAADDSVTTYAYDSLNRVLEETQQIGASAAGVISSAWRAANLRSGLTYPNGRQVEFTYDGLDRIDQVSDSGASLPIADYDYIGTYRVLVRAYPQNGTRMTYLDDIGTADSGYDGLRRPIQLRHLRNDDSLIVGFAHTYDRANNKLAEAKLHDPVNSEDYSYDSAYRLIDFVRPDPAAIDALHSGWQLDGAGNWQQVTSTQSGAPVTEIREHSSFNEVVRRDDGFSVSISYDDNGNSTDDGSLIFRWDYLNRLRSVNRSIDGAAVASYAYDASGRRMRVVVTNSGASDRVTDFYLDSWQEIEERDETGQVVQQYVYGASIDEPLVFDRNLDGDSLTTGTADQRLFYHQNTLSSVFALSSMPAVAGAQAIVVEGYFYDAYGRVTVFTPGSNGQVDFGGDDTIVAGGASPWSNPFLFTGRRLDSETNLYYFRARSFDAVLGRFLSRDPLGAQQGPNMYEYVSGRPTAYVDPMGLRERLAFVLADECRGKCGPDITGQLLKVTDEVIDAYNSSSYLAKIGGCNLNAFFDIQELHNRSVTSPNCPTGECSSTEADEQKVWMFGKCVYMHEANYYLFGVMVRTCANWLAHKSGLAFDFGGMKIKSWKMVRYAEFPSQETYWAYQVGYSLGNDRSDFHRFGDRSSKWLPIVGCEYCEAYRGKLHWYWEPIKGIEEMYSGGHDLRRSAWA